MEMCECPQQLIRGVQKVLADGITRWEEKET